MQTNPFNNPLSPTYRSIRQKKIDRFKKTEQSHQPKDLIDIYTTLPKKGKYKDFLSIHEIFTDIYHTVLNNHDKTNKYLNKFKRIEIIYSTCLTI